MNCPICWGTMSKLKQEYVPFYHYEDETTYYRLREVYHCSTPKCKVEYEDGKWRLPDGYYPTEKQLKTIDFICSTLDKSYDGVTKYEAILFIGANLNEAVEREHNMERDYLGSDCIADW